MQFAVATLIVLVVLILLAAPALAATKSWKTDGPSQYWSNPDNWSPTGVPQNGDDLHFNDTFIIFGPDPMVNDMVNLSVGGLSFAMNGTFEVDWVINGNPLTVRSINAGGGDNVYINCDLILGGNGLFFAPLTSGGGTTLRIKGDVDLNGHNLFLTAQAASVEVSGVISGNGNISVSGSRDAVGGGPQVIFNGANGNTFQGKVTVTTTDDQFGDWFRGNLVLDKQSGLAIPGNLRIERGGYVTLARSHQIFDGATVELVGTYTNLFGAQANCGFLLDGHNEIISSLIITNRAGETSPPVVDTGGGTLSIYDSLICRSDNEQSIPMINGKLSLAVDPQPFILVGSAYYGVDIAAQILGTGGISKTGNAALLLRGNNIFNGNVIIQQGIVEVRHANALGDLGGYTSLGAGALLLRNVAVGAEQLRADGQGVAGELPGSVLTSIGLCSWAGEVVLNTNLVVNGDLAFTGPITGPGGLGLFGGGTVQLGGNLPNTFSGLTLVRCPTLELNKSTGLRAFGGPLIVGGGAIPSVEVRSLKASQMASPHITLFANGTLNLNNFSDDVGPLTFNGGMVQTGTGTMNLYGPTTNNAASTTAVISGNVNLPSGLREFHVADGPPQPDLQITANVLGTGNLGKFGPGDLWLGGANTYSGATIIYGGNLIAASPTALGSSTVGTSVLDGSTLTLAAISGALTESISINGAGVGGVGALNVLGTTTLRNQFPSIFPCLALTTNATIRVESGVTLTADGFISGTGPLIKTGAGSLVFSNLNNANTYTGDTFVLAGTVDLRKNNGVVCIPGALTLGPASAGAPAVVRFFQSGGLATTTPTVNANSVLNLNNYNYTVTYLRLNDGGDVQTGSGTLFLGDFSTVSVGTLNPLGSVASSSITGNLWPPDAASTTLDVAPYGPNAPLGLPPELDIPANILGAFSGSISMLSKTGAGTARFSGNNNYWSRLRIFDGTLIAASATACGVTGANTMVNNGATLALEGSISINGESLFLNSGDAPTLESRAGANTWNGPITLTTNSIISVSQSLNIPTAITGAGSLTKRGSGTLTFIGSTNNSYAGNTIVEAGTLALGKTYGYQAVPASLIIGQVGGPAATALYQNHDQVWADITVNANGLLNLNGWDEYAGNLTLNGGGDVQTITGSLYVLGSNGITVNPGAHTTSTISGRLGFDAGDRTITVGSGATVPGVFDLEVTAVIFQPNNHSPVNLTKAGAGKARFNGNNTYTGTNTIAGGLLQIDGLQAQTPVFISSGRLQGTGTVGNIIYGASSTAIVAPGASPGMLTCSNFTTTDNTRGKLEIELNGTSPGSQYDQLNLRGTAKLAGLSLQPSLGFASAAGQTFTIVNNDGSDAVVGTFNGLSQNATLYIGGELFQISYAGGSGNDVVLTRLVTPPKPVLTIERVPPASVRLLWPTNDPIFSLQSNTNVNTTNWSLVSPPPSVSGTNNIVTNAATGVHKYYRLFQP